MGLIPEIERVWISIDHKLFLWDYIEGYVGVPSSHLQTDTTLSKSRYKLLRRSTRRHHPCSCRKAKSRRLCWWNNLRYGYLHTRVCSFDWFIDVYRPWPQQLLPQGNQIVCNRHDGFDRHRNDLCYGHVWWAYFHVRLPGRLSIRTALSAERIMVCKTGAYS